MSMQRWKSLLTTLLAGAINIHIYANEGMHSHRLFGRLITIWSAARINYPAFHNKNQGPSLRLFLYGIRRSVFSFISTRADTFDCETEINVAHHRSFVSRCFVDSSLFVCLSDSFSVVRPVKPVCLPICVSFIPMFSSVPRLFHYSPPYFSVVYVNSLSISLLIRHFLSSSFIFFLCFSCIFHFFLFYFVYPENTRLQSSTCYEHTLFWVHFAVQAS